VGEAAVRRLVVLFTALVTLVVGVPGAAQAAPLPTSMAAVGDSITRGYDATLIGCFLRDCPQHAWTTGTSSAVDSHYERLLRISPAIRGRVWNDARTGAKMADLGRQLTTVAGRDVQYVTVLIGANDVCTSSASTMTPVATFEGQFRQALGGFAATDPQAQVFVSSIPNVYQLWSLLRSRASTVWRSFGICQSMLASTNTEATRQVVLQRLKDFNGALARVCAEFAQCRWDGLATFNTAFTAADVSTVDYFHPSPAGQAKLATVTWGQASPIWQP
jgi:lysophospholipase L1-like esterase